MKQYGVITYDALDFDDAVLEVFNQLDALKRNNPTITYEDIDITFGFFKRTWVVLVYSYDDQMFGTNEISPATITSDVIKMDQPVIKFIGMPAHISPSDPEWRSKLEEWRQTLTS